MIVRIWEVKRVACYARAETFTEVVASVASMVATPLPSIKATSPSSLLVQIEPRDKVTPLL